MKIIIVVRDPVMRAISDYTQASSKRKALGVMPTFEEMAVVDGERLVTQPALEVSRTERFLGLEPGKKTYMFWWVCFTYMKLHSVVKPENFGVDPIKKFPCVRRADGTLHCLGKTKGRKHPAVRQEPFHSSNR
ncbi:unnamed protein product [Strongylus vulgaris]|uniref:Sulfotransferase domain-containing protein n=1 Tax=Strongylus vulgaris TaxID=40348 RepID=A0A3P7JZH2_STRVU|nr:unnamed protein product [Strongylus vulgaris]